MTKKPEITVLMALYNEEPAMAEKAIESILAQTEKRFELMLVLDNKKNTALRNIQKRYEKKDSRVRAFVNPKNNGLAHSLNRGIHEGRGAFYARMDADDIAHKDRFKKQLAYMKKHPKVDFLFSWVELFDYSGRSDPFTPPPEWAKNLKKRIFTEDLLLIHPTAFMRREAVQDGYDENMMRSQDLDLWLRKLKKHEFAIYPEILLRYYIPEAGNARKRVDKVKKYSQYGIKVLNKHALGYITNPYFGIKYARILFYRLVTLLPTAFLVWVLERKEAK